MSDLGKGIFSGAIAYLFGGGILSTIIIFLLVYWLVGGHC